MAILQLMLLLEVRCQTPTLIERVLEEPLAHGLSMVSSGRLSFSWKTVGVPELICGDDLEGQITRTKEFASAPWNVGAVVEDLILRGYHRFSEDFIGLHLERFTSSKQFMQVVYDAFIGMYWCSLSIRVDYWLYFQHIKTPLNCAEFFIATLAGQTSWCDVGWWCFERLGCC